MKGHAKELAEDMKVNLHNIYNVWSLFQTGADGPDEIAIAEKALLRLSDKEKAFLMFLGLDRVSIEMEKGEVG